MPHRPGGVLLDQVDHGQLYLDGRVIRPTLRSPNSRFERFAVIAKIEIQKREEERRPGAARIKFHRFLGQRHGIREAVERPRIQRRKGQVRSGPRRIDSDGFSIGGLCSVEAAPTLQRDTQGFFDHGRQGIKFCGSLYLCERLIGPGEVRQ